MSSLIAEPSVRKDPRPQGVSLLDVFRLTDQFHGSALLHFAVEHKLFDFLSQPRTATDVALKFKWDLRKTAIMLDAVAALGLISKCDGSYSNSRVAEQALVSSSSSYVGAVIDHQRMQWQLWNNIGDVLASKSALALQQDVRLNADEAANTAFNGAMVQLSRYMVGALVARPEFKGNKFVLDLAGGHGSYLNALARSNKELTGEIWDLAETEAAAQTVIAENGTADQIMFRVKDITQPDSYAGCTADIVMLNDCLHYFNDFMVEQLIAWGAWMLRPGGALMVLTMQLDDDRVSPASGADFSFHMMLNVANGGLQPTSTIRKHMEKQGLDVEVVDLHRYRLLVGHQAEIAS